MTDDEIPQPEDDELVTVSITSGDETSRVRMTGRDFKAWAAGERPISSIETHELADEEGTVSYQTSLGQSVRDEDEVRRFSEELDAPDDS